MMITIQASVQGTGCWSGQADGSGVPGRMLPNSSRAAWVTVDTGFHSANTRSGVGTFCEGANVCAMNVSGNTRPRALHHRSARRVPRCGRWSHSLFLFSPYGVRLSYVVR